MGTVCTVQNNTILLNKEPEFVPIEKSSVKGFIKHVRCEGARFHVVHYDDLGPHCSEEQCVLNARCLQCRLK
jgi:hypothetical protein